MEHLLKNPQPRRMRTTAATIDLFIDGEFSFRSSSHRTSFSSFSRRTGSSVKVTVARSRHGRDGASVARSKTREELEEKHEEHNDEAGTTARTTTTVRIVFAWGREGKEGAKRRERSEIFGGARDRFSP